jgi:hypothetical protein
VKYKILETNRTGAAEYKNTMFADPYNADHLSADEAVGVAERLIRENVVVRQPENPYSVILEMK